MIVVMPLSFIVCFTVRTNNAV